MHLEFLTGWLRVYHQIEPVLKIDQLWQARLFPFFWSASLALRLTVIRRSKFQMMLQADL